MSVRWDDNCLTDLKTRAVLLAHGHRGTFFLNDPTGNFYGKDYGLLGDRAAIERVLGPGNRVRFHLHQMQSLPRQVDCVATDGAEPVASTEFPAIVGLLGQHGGRLTLRLENRGTEPLEVQRVTYRLPLRYRDGVVRRGSFVLQAGQARADELVLQNTNTDSRYQAGFYFFAAQIDFTLRGSTGRVYFTAHAPSDFDENADENADTLTLDGWHRLWLWMTRGSSPGRGVNQPVTGIVCPAHRLERKRRFAGPYHSVTSIPARRRSAGKHRRTP